MDGHTPPASFLELNPALDSPLRRGLRFLTWGLLERWLLFPRLNALYAEVHEEATPSTFCERLLEAMQVTIDVSRDDLGRLPTTGPAIVVANHPHGGIEAAALVARALPIIHTGAQV